MNLVGVSYQRGLGTAVDLKEAVRWYRQAAEQGLDRAQSNLALCFDRGDGVDQDHKMAFEWCLKAALQGYSPAQFNLGIMYSLGQGVPSAPDPDLEQAFRWFLQAAQRGYNDGMLNVGVCYEQGHGVTKHTGKAFEWFLRAAEGGNTDAAMKVAEMYAQGVGVVKDLGESRKWMLRARGEDGDSSPRPGDFGSGPNGNTGLWPVLKTVQEYDEGITAHRLVIVYFFASWCAVCSELLPELKTLLADGQHDDIHVVRVDVDAVDTKDLIARYDVRMLPCLLYVCGGTVIASSKGKHLARVRECIRALRDHAAQHPVASAQTAASTLASDTQSEPSAPSPPIAVGSIAASVDALAMSEFAK